MNKGPISDSAYEEWLRELDQKTIQFHQRANSSRLDPSLLGNEVFGIRRTQPSVLSDGGILLDPGKHNSRAIRWLNECVKRHDRC